MYNKGVSVFILTKNCETTVKRTLDTVKWADEIIIVDGFSTDKTIDICKKYGAKIFQRKFEGFDKERNFGISKCSHEWIFEIDADEYLTKELEDDIKKVVSENPAEDYFLMRRKDYYIQRYLITLKIIRLYRNGIARYVGSTHERIIINGKKGSILRGYAEHKATDTNSIFDDVKQMDRETEKELLKRFHNKSMGKFGLVVNMVLRPPFLFLAWYIFGGYFRSGMTGLIFCLNNSFYEFLIYVKYYERKYIHGNSKVKKDKMRNL